MSRCAETWRDHDKRAPTEAEASDPYTIHPSSRALSLDSPAFQRVFDHFVDSGMMADTITCKNNGATYDTTRVPAKGKWLAAAGMTISDWAVKNATNVNQGFTQTSVYICGTRMAAIWRKQA
jgi:hypothetical protein